MKPTLRYLLAVIVGATLVGLTSVAPVAHAAPVSMSCSFKRVPVPVPLNRLVAKLADVSVISPTDAWAVGSYARAFGRPDPLIEHWQGTAWKAVAVPSPGPEPDSTTLSSVAVMSPSSVWAIGNDIAWRHHRLTSRSQGVLYRWTGRAWWRAKLPRLGGRETLSAIDIVGPGDVWIVGEWQHAAPGFWPVRPLFMHWNGKSWSVSRPELYPGYHHTLLYDVTNAASGVLAVGGAYKSGYVPPGHAVKRANFFARLINGSWVTTPISTTTTSEISSVSGSYAVGAYTLIPNPDYPATTSWPQLQTATALHFTGSDWVNVPTPALSYFSDDGDYVPFVGSSDVVDLGASSAWLSGNVTRFVGPVNQTWSTPYVEHWDGAAWSRITIPVPSVPNVTLNALDATSSSASVMAVGELSKTESEHSWTPVAYVGSCT